MRYHLALPMGDRDERRQFRYACEIAVEVRRGRARAWHMTRDIGFRGVFICTDVLPPLRHLLQLGLMLPEGQRVETHGMVVHLVKEGHEREVGFGVQLLGLDGRARAAWDHFVHRRVRESKGLRVAGN